MEIKKSYQETHDELRRLIEQRQEGAGGIYASAARINRAKELARQLCELDWDAAVTDAECSSLPREFQDVMRSEAARIAKSWDPKKAAELALGLKDGWARRDLLTEISIAAIAVDRALADDIFAHVRAFADAASIESVVLDFVEVGRKAASDDVVRTTLAWAIGMLEQISPGELVSHEESLREVEAAVKKRGDRKLSKRARSLVNAAQAEEERRERLRVEARRLASREAVLSLCGCEAPNDREIEAFIEEARRHEIWDPEEEVTVPSYDGQKVFIGEGDDQAEWMYGFEVIDDIDTILMNAADCFGWDDAEPAAVKSVHPLFQEDLYDGLESLKNASAAIQSAYLLEESFSYTYAYEVASTDSESWGGESPGRSGVYLVAYVPEERFALTLRELWTFRKRLCSYVVSLLAEDAKS